MFTQTSRREGLSQNVEITGKMKDLNNTIYEEPAQNNCNYKTGPITRQELNDAIASLNNKVFSWIRYPTK